jgi:hypothetical protein
MPCLKWFQADECYSTLKCKYTLVGEQFEENYQWHFHTSKDFRLYSKDGNFTSYVLHLDFPTNIYQHVQEQIGGDQQTNNNSVHSSPVHIGAG